MVLPQSNGQGKKRDVFSNKCYWGDHIQEKYKTLATERKKKIKRQNTYRSAIEVFNLEWAIFGFFLGLLIFCVIVRLLYA